MCLNPDTKKPESISTERQFRTISYTNDLDNTEFFAFEKMTPETRPISVATEFIDVDWDELESENSISDHEYSASSPRSSMNSLEPRSTTTVSDADEVQTPRSLRGLKFHSFRIDSCESAESLRRPVERPQVAGPRGPHLFRSSISSAAEYANALSMSPIVPKTPAWVSYVFSSDAIDEPLPAPIVKPRRKSEPIVYSQQVLDPTTLESWSPAMVAQWMVNAGLEPTLAERFMANDISGEIVMTLKLDDLKELGIQSFGLRAKAWEMIRLLQNSRLGSPIFESQGADTSVNETPIQDTPNTEVHYEQQALFKNLDSVPPVSARPPGRAKRLPHPRYSNGLVSRDDAITPLESISIVGIEQVMPRPHTCSKGEKCTKWRRTQRLMEAFKKEYPFIDIENGGDHIIVTGDPGNPATAPRLAPASPLRPVSDAEPSVVASSDVLGPGLMPSVRILDESALSAVLRRDPQDHVRHFLRFQMSSANCDGGSEVPPTPPFVLTPNQPPMQQKSMSQKQLHSLPKLAIPSVPGQTVQPSQRSFTPYRMSVVDARSPDLQRSEHPTVRFGTPFSDMDVAVVGGTVTSAALTAAAAAGPVARDASQSVPPDMTYRTGLAKPVRTASRHSKRPSISTMPALDENKIFALTSPSTPATAVSGHPASYFGPLGPSPTRPASTSATSPARGLPASPKAWKNSGQPMAAAPPRSDTVTEPPPSTRTEAVQEAGSKAEVNTGVLAPTKPPPRRGFPFSHSVSETAIPPGARTTSANTEAIQFCGPMRKRRTKMLRHEWNDGFFTLRGTRLNMHPDAQSLGRTLEYVDIDDYAIACSSVAGTSKLRSAFRAATIKSLGWRHDDKTGSSTNTATCKDIGGFSFQLVPQQPESMLRAVRLLTGAAKRKGSFGTGDNGDGKTVNNGSAEGDGEGINGTGKTHHFAVKSREQRIDWMRELMLAKALRKKVEGFEVTRNGNMV